VWQTLLGLLASPDDAWTVNKLVRALTGLDPTAEERQQVWQTLLGLLASPDDAWTVNKLVRALTGLDPTAEDRRRARKALIGLLAKGKHGWIGTQDLTDAVIQFDPIAEDLSNGRTSTFPLTNELLAAVRQNSALAAWLALLPSLSSMSS
jgi:hypothetical protein